MNRSPLSAVWTLARKDLRLLLRDVRALIILLAMPLIFILMLGLMVGEWFGQQDRLRVSVVDLDEGVPGTLRRTDNFPPEKWSKMVLRDLADTADIQVELIASKEEADRLVKSGRRPAVLVLGPKFSENVQRCSFLAEGVNPFFRDGIRKQELDVEVLIDRKQPTSAAIIEQVAQGCLMRIVLPWMIGGAFEEIGEPRFLDKLGTEPTMPKVMKDYMQNKMKFGFVNFPFGDKEKKELGDGLKSALQNLYPKYQLTAKTWASLTREKEHEGSSGDKIKPFEEDGKGWLKQGARRYQLLVPLGLVMFAFFLVLTFGWLFVAERRQGTMLRLRAAPLARWQILLGKVLPCFLVSLCQGFFLLLAGRLIFGMKWGPEPLLLIPVVVCTSFAAVGLALLMASLAQTETQVAVYGTLLVLVLGGLGCFMLADRSSLPESLQTLILLTPQAWALDAYLELLAGPETVNVAEIAKACGVLAAFGAGLMLISWWLLRLE